MTSTVKPQVHIHVIVTGCICAYFCTVVRSGGGEEMKRLHRSLLENYNPDVRPCKDYSTPLNVTARLHLADIIDLDIKNQVMKLIGYVSIIWTDDYLQWNDTAYGGITDIMLPEKKVWKPDIAIYNSIDERVYLGSEETLVAVTSSGEVRWEPVINMAVTCKVDVSKYPFDQNTCFIDLLAWMNDNSSIRLMPADNPIDQTSLQINGQFWVSSGGANMDFSELYGKFYVDIMFKINLKRRPSYLVLTLIVPVTLLAILSVLSFLLSPEEPEKVSVAITVLLSFTVFLGVVDNDLPETSDHLCLIVAYVVIQLILAFICVAGNAVIVVVYKRDLKLGRMQSSAMLGNLLAAQEQSTQNYGDKRLRNILHLSGATEETSVMSGRKHDLALDASREDLHWAYDEKRAHRMNKYCLLLNGLALTSVVCAFMILLLQ